MIDLTNVLESDKQYLVATSGGPDSMALLDMCVQQGFSISAFHMNYHKRDSANRDQQIVQEYCKNHGLQCYVSDYQHSGLANFQADARKARYSEAAKLMQQYKFDALLVAHQKDDVIETYIMQKESKREVNYYGLASSTTLFGVKVIRPLLSLTKAQCQNYCDSHHIRYGIDESNLSNDYTRNKIRHDIIDTLSEKEKEEYINQINFKNIQCEKQQCYRLIDDSSIEIYDCNDQNSKAKALRQLLCQLDSSYGKKSHQYYLDVLASLENKKVYSLNNNWYLFFDNNRYWIEQIKPMQPITLTSLNYGHYGSFCLADNGTVRQGISANENEFPLTVRNWQNGDSIETKFGIKKVSRWMIDNKMHPSKRLITKVIVNNCGKVIYLSGFGCDYSHYYHHKKVFMVE